ncbi:MAG: hypothetical protein SFV22_07595 [Saprospiraceae bacterium]|nr:hypothetical protein [Saprospiraceae bacterium]
MKHLPVLLLLLLLTTAACKKEDKCTTAPPWIEVNLPDSVQLGETIMYLNGEVADYKPNFAYIQVYQLMGCGFEEVAGDIVNSFGFSRLPLETGNFQLQPNQNETVEGKAVSGFSQVVDEDIRGYSYQLEESVNGFIHVEYLDTAQQIVKGRFKVAFCRTSKNDWEEDLGLPEHLQFQGVFHEKYKVE